MRGPCKALAAVSLVLVLVGCGEEPAGPDVRGLNLVDAKKKLEHAGVETTVHAEDALLGVLVEENFVVCDVEAVSEHIVRLEVAKHGC